VRHWDRRKRGWRNIIITEWAKGSTKTTQIVKFVSCTKPRPYTCTAMLWWQLPCRAEHTHEVVLLHWPPHPPPTGRQGSCWLYEVSRLRPWHGCTMTLPRCVNWPSLLIQGNFYAPKWDWETRLMVKVNVQAMMGNWKQSDISSLQFTFPVWPYGIAEVRDLRGLGTFDFIRIFHSLTRRVTVLKALVRSIPIPAYKHMFYSCTFHLSAAARKPY